MAENGKQKLNANAMIPITCQSLMHKSSEPFREIQ